MSRPGGAVPRIGDVEDGQFLKLVVDKFVGADPASGSDRSLFSAVNKDVVQIKAGQPVAIHGSGTGIVLAGAALNGMYAVGLATEDIDVGASGNVQTELALQLADWTAATGSSALSAKATYWLSDTPGQLSTTPPSSSGHLLQEVIRELAGDTADLVMNSPILL